MTTTLIPCTHCAAPCSQKMGTGFADLRRIKRLNLFYQPSDFPADTRTDPEGAERTLASTDWRLLPGANPTIVSYNASAVKIYNALLLALKLRALI
jgi:hypothetical protein